MHNIHARFDMQTKKQKAGQDIFTNLEQNSKLKLLKKKKIIKKYQSSMIL